MWTSAFILAQGGDDSGNQLIYVIAVIVLSLGGFLVEKVKSAMAKRDEHEQHRSPRPTGGTATREVRPAARPHPSARSHEGLPQRPHHPGSSVPDRPVSHRPRPPARPPVPAQPLSGRPHPPARPPVPIEHPPKARPAGRRPRPFEEAQEVWKQILQQVQPQTQAPQPRPAKPTPASPPAAPPSRARGPLTSIQGKARDEPTTVAAIGTLIETKAISKTRAVPLQRGASFQGLTTAELQRAFILKEVLDKPLALREGVFNALW